MIILESITSRGLCLKQFDACLTGTPADKMLGMMSDLLDGTIPSIQDILFIQSAVLESLDIYKPMDVAKQLMQAGNLDVGMGLY